MMVPHPKKWDLWPQWSSWVRLGEKHVQPVLAFLVSQVIHLICSWSKVPLDSDGLTGESPGFWSEGGTSTHRVCGLRC